MPIVTNNWFGETPGRIAPIPGQIAKILRNMGEFRSFAELRETLWRLVAEDPRLAPKGGWSKSNQTRMKGGRAPRVVGGQATGGGSNAKLQLNHRQAVEHAGDVYDLDNLEVVTPKMHGDMRM